MLAQNKTLIRAHRKKARSKNTILKRPVFEIRHDTDTLTDMKHGLCVDLTSLATTF